NRGQGAVPFGSWNLDRLQRTIVEELGIPPDRNVAVLADVSADLLDDLVRGHGASENLGIAVDDRLGQLRLRLHTPARELLQRGRAGVTGDGKCHCDVAS